MMHDEIVRCFNSAEFSDIPENGSRAIMMFSNKKYHTFLFRNTAPNRELFETGYDFFKEGVMDFPYEDCIFSVQNKGDEFCIFVTKIDENYFAINCRYDYNDYGVRSVSAIACMTLPFGTQEKIKMVPVNLKKSQPEMEADAMDTIAGLCQLVMMINMKSVERETIVHDEKLQTARAKRGKARLLDYVIIKDPTTARQGQCGTHASPIPHWRRGHTRTWGDRKIPIAPVIVNAWKNGGKEPPKPKTYIVDKTNSAPPRAE